MFGELINNNNNHEKSSEKCKQLMYQNRPHQDNRIKNKNSGLLIIVPKFTSIAPCNVSASGWLCCINTDIRSSLSLSNC